MRNLFKIFYVLLLFIPAFTIFYNTTDIASSFKNTVSASYLLLRVSALFGISLLFVQMILGTFMSYFGKIFGARIRKYHMSQGIIAYFIILSHPLFYTFYSLQTVGFGQTLFGLIDITANFSNYIIFGEIGLGLLTIAVLAGVFRGNKLIAKNWRKIHKTNYIVFPFVLIHSFFLGQDSRIFPFVFLYPLFLGGFIYAVYYKIKNPV